MSGCLRRMPVWRMLENGKFAVLPFAHMTSKDQRITMPPSEHLIGVRLTAIGETLATAESCSGGLIAHRLTNVPGSSAYFRGGVVVYSNDLKMRLLGVEKVDLQRHGAVSAQVAQAMAEGACQRLQAAWGIGVTGIAGPGGGTVEKPVGLVYIAVAGPERTVVTENRFEGSREEIKAATAERALAMLLEQIS